MEALAPLDPAKLAAEVLESKKYRILAAIVVGMDVARACLMAGCTNEETDTLYADPQFIMSVKFSQVDDEFKTLLMHKDGRKIAAEKGNTGPIEWYLGKTNPERWAGKVAGEGPKSGIPNREINFNVEEMTDEELRALAQ